MFVKPGPDALIAALAAAIAGRIRPGAEGEARYYCDAALAMIARYQLASGVQNPALARIAETANDGALSLSPHEQLAALGHERDLAIAIEPAVADALRRFDDIGTFLPLPGPQALAEYLASRGAGERVVRNINERVGGNSKQTIMFDTLRPDGRTEPMVLRRDHPDCYAGTCSADEYPLVRALFDAGFPVPEPLWCERGGSPLVPGTFLISRRAPGDGIGDYFHIRPDFVGDALGLLAGIMVRLHAIDPDTLGDEALASAKLSREGLLARIGYWRDRYQAQTPKPLMTIQLAFDWLRRNVDVGLEMPAIVHGDPGCHNILVENGAVTALIDWELGTIGSVAEDLAYCRGHAERIGSFAYFLDRYEQSGGRIPSAAALEYYDVFQLARSLSLFAAATRYFDDGRNDDVAVMQAIGTLTSSHIDMLAAMLQKFAGENRLLAPAMAHDLT